MNNHVVVALCEALAATGQPALRFNFRGAWRSEGAHAGGVGEREDALAALDEARSAGAKSVSLAGYSFGAAIAASVADEARVERLVLVSPPTIGGAIRVPAEIPTLVVTGANDRVSAAEAVRALTGSNVTAVVLPGVDHGWWPGVDDLTRLVVEFAR
jgi:alpha/beta superfamily hydrolase